VARRVGQVPGFLMVGVLLLVVAAAIAFGLSGNSALVLTASVAASVLVLLISTGFVVVNPNDAQVVQFFGRYIGTIREAGFFWTWPLTSKRRVTLRVRNFETERLKVSDKAQMVSNLLVVLCGDRAAQPVVNTGSLYG
jgi:regulator of protease activity HflC (stomatin/prohibitin superfamily)